MAGSEVVTIPERRGKAAFMRAGQLVKVINTFGQQVVDTWAFDRNNLGEFMSMEHTRSHITKVIPGIGDAMRSNRRRPILTFVEDNSGGIHDTLMAACDRYRYELFGCKEYHDNCTDNLIAGMAELGLVPPEVPSPLNLFMNIPVHQDDTLSFEPPVSTPGSFVVLRAEMDLVIAFSACPQDLLPINGVDREPTAAHFSISG
jgi:uncharacterized protein YcgI (DUF1989 family)